MAAGPQFIVAAILSADPDIRGNRASEKEGVLVHHGDVLAQRSAGDFSYVLPVNQDCAFGHVVKARNERQERRLSGTGRPHDSGLGIRREVQAGVLKNGLIRPVGEPDLAKFDCALDRRENGRTARFGRTCRFVQEPVEEPQTNKIRLQIDAETRPAASPGS